MIKYNFYFWRNITDLMIIFQGVNDFLRIERISDTLVTQIDNSYSEFTGNITPSTPQRRRAPLPEEQCLYLIERTKMLQTMDKLEHLQTECYLYLSSFNSVVSDWYKQAVTAYIQPEIVFSDIRQLQEKMAISEGNLVVAVNGFKAQLAQVTNSLSLILLATSAGSTDSRQSRKSVKAKVVRDRLHELVRVQEEIQSKFKVNFELCNQLQGLLMNSLGDTTS